MFKVLVEPNCNTDIENACRYYSTLPVDTNKLINHFFEDMQVAFDALSINPFYPYKTQNYRFIPLKRFPYILFFTVNESEKTVFVLALFHTNQDTNKYPK